MRPGPRPGAAGAFALFCALLACGSSVSQEDRDTRRAACAKEPGFDATSSNEALNKLRAGACRSTLWWTKCADWWDYVVTACVFEREGVRQIDVHSSLWVETDTAREHREGICDAVREQVSMSDPAWVVNGRGTRITTCGKPRKKR